MWSVKIDGEAFAERYIPALITGTDEGAACRVADAGYACRHQREGGGVKPFRTGANLREEIGIAYEVWNLTLDRRAARGHTSLATLDREGTLLFEVPDEIVRRIRP